MFNPAENVTVADINTVPADFRFLYKAGENGQHVLDSESPATKSALAIFNDLNGTVKRLRNDVKTAGATKVDLTPLADYGTEPVAIAETVQQKIQSLTDQLKGVNVKQIKEGIEKEWSPKVAAANERSDKLNKKLTRVLVDGEALTSIGAEKGDAELLLPHVKGQLQVIENNGDYEVRVVDPAGEARYVGERLMTVAELVKEMKASPKFGKLFESQTQGGTGAAQSGQRAAAGTAANFGNHPELSSTQKIAQGLSKGQAGAHNNVKGTGTVIAR